MGNVQSVHIESERQKRASDILKRQDSKIIISSARQRVKYIVFMYMGYKLYIYIYIYQGLLLPGHARANFSQNLGRPLMYDKYINCLVIQCNINYISFHNIKRNCF